MNGIKKENEWKKQAPSVKIDLQFFDKIKYRQKTQIGKYLLFFDCVYWL